MEKTAFISDIHANAVALNAVLEDVWAQGCRRIFVLGDIVNGMEPSKCIAILQGIENIAYIQGDAELYVLTPDLDAFLLRDETIYPSLLKVIWWWQEHLSPADIETIRNWPETLQLDGWYLVHDSPADRAAARQADLDGVDEKYRQILFHGRGIFENMSDDELDPTLAFMEENNISSLFVGHTHEPCIRHVDGKTICNPGSVGFNLDGDPRPSWILCESDGLQQHFSIRRVRYNIDQAIQRLLEVGYLDFTDEREQNAYIKMLQTGVHWRAHL